MNRPARFETQTHKDAKGDDDAQAAADDEAAVRRKMVADMTRICRGRRSFPDETTTGAWDAWQRSAKEFNGRQ